jgi:hypothetical protein
VRNENVARYEGRLFAEDGRLHMVVEANEAEGVARVSCRIDGEHCVLEMPLDEVCKHISSGKDLVLDNINSADSLNRVVERADGWYLSAREGWQGPYALEDEAAEALSKYIVAVQSAA